MKNTTLLFDFISGEILEFPSERELEIVQEKHQQYNEEYIVFGKDYFEGHNVWFIKGVLNTYITRNYLERQVLDYLMKK